MLEKLAQRDLSARVTGSYEGDHAKIKEAVNGAAQALHDAMAQVAQVGEQVSSASGADRVVEPGGGERRLRAGGVAGGDELQPGVDGRA